MISPNEQQRTASISTAKMLSPAIAASRQPVQRGGPFGGVAGMEVAQPRQLVLFLLVGGTGQFEVDHGNVSRSGLRNVLTPMSGRLPSCLRCS